MKPLSVVNCCGTCVHGENCYEYDGGWGLMCNSTLDRPKCGSVAMEEEWNYKDDKEFGEAIDKWMEWMKIHKVEDYNICEDFVKKC